MTDMPNRDWLVDIDTTELEFQTALGDFFDVVNQMAGQGPASAVTIAAGVVTPDKAHIVVDTEGAAAADDLDRIVATTIGDKLLMIRSTSDARVVTLRHNQTGIGKLMMRTAGNVALTSPNQLIAFRWDPVATSWVEIWRNWGYYAPAGYNPGSDLTALGLGTAAVKNTGTSGDTVPLLNAANTWSENISITAADANRSLQIARTGTGASNVFIGTASGGGAVGTSSNGPFRFLTNNTVRMSIEADGGVVIGSPTGGSKGAGTLNVQSGLYVNGALLTGGISDVQTFPASGTWNKPSAGTYAFIRLWGAGGAGGQSISVINCGGGGGGGAYAEAWIPLSTLPSSVAVGIGAGGTVGTRAGGIGGTSSFGSLLLAYGGGGGNSGTSGGGGGGGGGAGTTSAGLTPANAAATPGGLGGDGQGRSLDGTVWNTIKDGGFGGQVNLVGALPGIWGGGGGGGADNNTSDSIGWKQGGRALMGGGGGGGSANHDTNGRGLGGSSGAGGAGGDGSNAALGQAATAGQQPGGGGGGGSDPTGGWGAGAGGDGYCEVIIVF